MMKFGKGYQKGKIIEKGLKSVSSVHHLINHQGLLVQKYASECCEVNIFRTVLTFTANQSKQCNRDRIMETWMPEYKLNMLHFSNQTCDPQHHWKYELGKMI